ncbi:MAG: hypothetical protein DMG21_00890 [Acidobacteria bacterium]|nr:MAG: hypothetical protein DMG21_00890 [Acidobacteriota bacterium]
MAATWAQLTGRLKSADIAWYVIKADQVPEALVLKEPEYVPAATSTVSPGCAKVEAGRIDAQGSDRVQRYQSLRLVEAYQVFAQASGAPKSKLAIAARISRNRIRAPPSRQEYRLQRLSSSYVVS